jgi:hypothetical protein
MSIFTQDKTMFESPSLSNKKSGGGGTVAARKQSSNPIENFSITL